MSTNPVQLEKIAFGVLVFLLGVNALFNAASGFLWPLFVVTILPSIALAFVFTLQPIIFGDAAYKVYPLDLLLSTLIGATLLLGIRTARLRKFFHRSDKWFLGFMLLVSMIGAATFFGFGDGDAATAFSTWKQYVFYPLIVFVVAFFVRAANDRSALARVFLWSVAGASIFLIIGIVRGGGLWTEYTPLSTAGTRLLAFPHALYFALAFLAVLLSAAYWNRSEKKPDRMWFLLGVLGLGILASLMRHLWLALGGTLVAALLMSPLVFGRALFRGGRRFLLPLLLLVAGAWFVFALLPYGQGVMRVQENVSTLGTRVFSIGNQYDESLVWRGKVLESAWQEFQAQPFFGIGFGASVPVEIGDYQQYVEVRDMHNSWLALLIQTGLLGAGLFVFWVGSIIIALVRETKKRDDPELRLAGFVLGGLFFFQSLAFFSQPYLETNLLSFFFWVTLGVMRGMLFEEPAVPDTITDPYAHS